MVNVLRHAPKSPVVDEQAMQQFRHGWQLYRKAVDHDYLWHREVCRILHKQLIDEVKRPFRFLDLACGDASMIVVALKDTPVTHYHGIDLSAPALELARTATEVLPCPVKLEQNDFVTAMRSRPEPADVVWIGLSLHHLQTPDKQAFMHAIRGVVGDSGVFMLYEPTRLEGESLEAYLDRFEQINKQRWAALTPSEWQEIMQHVRTSDLPETASVWRDLGRAAGFTQVQDLFSDVTQLFKVFRFRP